MSRLARIALPVGLVCVVDVVLVRWLGRAQFADQALATVRIWDDHLLFAVRHYHQDALYSASFLPDKHAHWGAGVILRVAGVPPAAARAVASGTRGLIRHGGQCDAVVVPALLSGPPAGILVGLINVIPEGFASGSTVESRELVWALAVRWMLDGALWGLLCGSVAALVCVLVLALRTGKALLARPVPAGKATGWSGYRGTTMADDACAHQRRFCLAVVAQSAILDPVARAVG